VTTKGKIRFLIQNNDLSAAKRLCKSYCKCNKTDAEAWFLLGSVCGQIGEPERATEYLQRSIALQGDLPMTHLNLGLVYLRLNQPENARSCFEKALSLNPGFTAARHELANSILSAGRPENAIPHYRAALQNAPGSPDILLNLASALLATGESAGAITAIRQALQIQPVNPDAHFRLGNLLLETGDCAAAAANFRMAVNQRPDFAEALVNLGNALLHTDSGEEAIAAYQTAARLRGDSADILFNLGNAYRAEQRLEEAESSYRKALHLNPQMSVALNNLGITLIERGSYSEAERCYIQSIELNSHQLDAYINLASCYRDQRKTELAIDTLRRALSIYPEQAELHWDLSLLLLATGNFSEGWSEYEWRSMKPDLQFREFPFPEWAGEPVRDKTILVTAEQGIGDEIMFASCFNDLINISGQVIIECEPRLAPLFKRSFPAACVVAARQTADLSWLDEIPAPDYCISAGCLPHHFRNHADDFSTNNNYLVADTTEVNRWHERLTMPDCFLTVGISWKGGHISQTGRRTTKLEDWEPILSIPGIVFVNLQYGDTGEERAAIQEHLGIKIHHWQDSDPLRNMDRFAAQISSVDLVISIDNSTVHLAGALGINTWVLQPFVADWRWMTPSEDSYWYSVIRQFFQTEPGNWESPLLEVREALLAGSPHPANNE